MTLTRLHGDVFAASTTVDMGMGLELPARSVILRDVDGGLVLVSPILFSVEDVRVINELGEVRCIVAPNLFHHLYLRAAREVWPDAAVVAPTGLPDKVGEFGPFTSISAVAENGPLHGVHFYPIAGLPKVEESLLWHEPSETLLVTDLFFNNVSASTVRGRTMLRATGVLNRCARSRLIRMLTADRRSACDSLQQVLERRIQRIVPAHGDVIDEDCDTVLRNTLRWMLGNGG